MYSILIKNGEKKYSFCLNADGTKFSGDSETVKAKLIELLGTYPMGNLEVVHNVTVTSEFSIEDVE